jgi:hypothetical protein
VDGTEVTPWDTAILLSVSTGSAAFTARGSRIYPGEPLKGKMPKGMKLDSTGTAFAFQGF